MADIKNHFNIWDWVVFGALLLVSLGIGVYYALTGVKDKKNTTGEFLMGSRNLKLLPVAISILVSFMSAILILGTPAEMYTAGTMYCLYMFGIALAIILSAQLFLPLFYPLKLTSSFEYLEKRFNSKAAKLTGTVIMVIQQIIYMGIASFAPSTALEAVTGFPTWATIITIGCVSTVYTFLSLCRREPGVTTYVIAYVIGVIRQIYLPSPDEGGMKAVVWTDTFQSVIMLSGLLAILIQGTVKAGGLGEVWRINTEWDRINFWEANPDPTIRHSVWSLVVGGAVTWLGVYGSSQTSVQRYCALPTMGKARWAILLGIPGAVIFVAVTSLAGIVMFAYYAKKGCDPLSNHDVSNSNQLIPYFVMEILGYPGLPGLFISCLFSGALSSMSSSLNALSAVVWEDMIKPYIRKDISMATQTWITRVLVAAFGAAGIGFAFLAKNMGGTVLQASLSFTGAATGPGLGIFLLGALFPWANWLGCVVGGILGLIVPLWISIGAYSLPRSGYALDFPTDNCTNINVNMTSTATAEITGIQLLYTVSYLWFPAIGVAISVIVGLLVSLVYDLIKGNEISMTSVDPKYLIPLFDRLFCCLPERWRRTLRCNMEFQDPSEIQPDDIEVGEESVHGSQEVDTKFPDGPSIYPATGNGIDTLSYKANTDGHFVCDNNVFTKPEVI